MFPPITPHQHLPPPLLLTRWTHTHRPHCHTPPPPPRANPPSEPAAALAGRARAVRRDAAPPVYCFNGPTRHSKPRAARRPAPAHRHVGQMGTRWPTRQAPGRGYKRPACPTGRRSAAAWRKQLPCVRNHRFGFAGRLPVSSPFTATDRGVRRGGADASRRPVASCGCCGP
ncbi:hypothetical protein PVAP13_6KG035815 [Panicum virgatum]|uniref:Uncharacterized protein n=1 Tax=Panicum virgatum TaxID=38727 RepID=A0A8T0R8N7_PANVG|nr:hypothetical protein PVAP13_6KG035815 [Panicum virgatum]